MPKPLNEVRIFQDPITMKKFEGSAKVIEVDTADDPTSFCKIRFLAGPQPRVSYRWVDNEQLRAAGFLRNLGEEMQRG